MNLANIVRYWARQKPADTALSTDVDTSWAQLDLITDSLARGLRAQGVVPGDRIAILASNCLEYCQAVIAAFKLGAVFVPLNERLTVPEVAAILEDCGSRIIITDRQHGGIVRDALAAITADAVPRSYEIGLGEGPRAFHRLVRADGTVPVEAIGADTVALICYTSGTTGLPKGAMLSHGGLWSAAISRVLVSEMTHRDIGYLPFSLSFAGGIAGVYLPLYVVGARMILDAGYDPVRTMDVIQNARVTVFSAVPVIWEQMVQHPAFADHDLTSLRSCFSGGAPVPLPLIETVQRAGIPMAQAYGLTETCALSAVLSSQDARRKAGSAGLPILHCQVKIADEHLHDCPRGDVGELLVRGPHVMKGYWNQPEATAEALVDGWLRTGDLGKMDDEGYVTLVDRAKDLIISGGLNIYPAEIENIVSELPGVIEVAVIGVENPKWGEIAVVVVRSQAPLDPAAIRARCAGRLSDYKHPKFLIARDVPMPRSGSGKIMKRHLRQEYARLPPHAVGLSHAE